jgi:hypothetical protein
VTGPGRGPELYATLQRGHLSARARGWLPGGGPYLLPATAFAEPPGAVPGGLRVPALPAGVGPVAVDCGAFASWAAGGAPAPWTTAAAYADWAEAVGAAWAALPDALAAGPAAPGVLAASAERMAAVWAAEAWRPFAWVPTVHGRAPEEYHAQALRLGPLVREQQSRYWADESLAEEAAAASASGAAPRSAAAWRVGVGGLKLRKRDQLPAVVAAVAEALPGVPLHLWGVSLAHLVATGPLPAAVASFDTANWNGRFPGRIDAQDAARAGTGLSQAAYGLVAELPRYRAKLAAYAARPRLPGEGL